MKWVLIVPACVIVAASVAFVLDRLSKPSENGYPPSSEIEFRDDAETNASPTTDSLVLTFVDLAGQPVALEDFRGKQNVVLVFTRGFSGAVCTYCSAQTSRLIAQHDEFARRNAAILVVFPGPKEHVNDFIDSSERQAKEKVGKASPLPFPILLDVDFKAVDRLGIRADLAKPSTYILDKQGDLRFAYVGSNMSDRPSVKAMLAQLDAIESETN